MQVIAFNFFFIFVSAFQMEFLLLIISSSLLGILNKRKWKKANLVFFILNCWPEMLSHASKASHEADYPQKCSVT